VAAVAPNTFCAVGGFVGFAGQRAARLHVDTSGAGGGERRRRGAGETMAALMPEHPARTIVVRLSGAGERALAERVYAQCWMPFGERRQICCEQIEITASDAAPGRFAIGGAAAGGARPPGDGVVQKRAPV